jgi:hypothetical protein
MSFCLSERRAEQPRLKSLGYPPLSVSNVKREREREREREINHYRGAQKLSGENL